jgi:hypothetical protein
MADQPSKRLGEVIVKVRLSTPYQINPKQMTGD